MDYLNPLAALWGLLTVPIVLLYFLRQEQLPAKVSSIIPWRKVIEDPFAERRRFNPDLLFWLQILLITLLTIGLMRFYWLWTVKADRVVLVFDASASMQARTGGGSRLEAAKAKAVDLVDNLSSEGQVLIIRAGIYPEGMSGFLNNKTESKDIISGLKGGETRGSMTEAVNLALSEAKNAGGAKLYLFTDSYRPDLVSLAAPKKLNFQISGKETENLAITAVDVPKGLYNTATQRRVYVTLQSYAQKPLQARLNILLDKRLLWRSSIELEPGENRTLPFGELPSQGVLEARLDIQDDLMLDNRAYAVIRKAHTVQLLLVSSDEPLADNIRRICNVVKTVQFRWVRPSEYIPQDAQNVDLAIFHRFVPEPLVSMNSLYIMPPKSKKFIKIQDEQIDNPHILDWDRGHPALKYLGFLDELTLEAALGVEPPSWASPIISSWVSPLAWAGEEGGHRIVTVGFDLGQYLFPPSQDVSGLVLLLNILEWLAPEAPYPLELTTGERYILKDSSRYAKAQIKTPQNRTFNVAADQEGHIVFSETDEIGEYEVRVWDNNGRELRRDFVANLLSETESELRIRPLPPTGTTPDLASEQPEPKTGAQTSGILEEKQHEFWRYLVLLALGVLLYELWVYLRQLS